MGLIAEGLVQPIGVLVSGDREVGAATFPPPQAPRGATLLSRRIGIPAGTVLPPTHFPGRALVISAVNTRMGLPPVVVGRFVTILLWRSGAFGALELLYTPAAMVLAQR